MQYRIIIKRKEGNYYQEEVRVELAVVVVALYIYYMREDEDS